MRRCPLPTVFAALVLVGCGAEHPPPELGSTEGAATVGTTVTTAAGSLDATVAEVGEAFFATPSGAWLGRLFVPADFDARTASVAVLTHDFWTRLGGEPSVVGAPLVVGGVPRIVIGVAPPGFAVPEETDLWLPRPSPTTSADEADDASG